MSGHNMTSTLEYIRNAKRRNITYSYRSCSMSCLHSHWYNDADCDEAISENDEHCKNDEVPKVAVTDLDWTSFTSRRHQQIYSPTFFIEPKNPTWRKKDKLKTVGVAIVLCLNVGIDPPCTKNDAHKAYNINPTECWTNLKFYSPNQAVELVGKKLQKNYERYQPKVSSQHGFDPTFEELRKICMKLRRKAKSDRVLFHYNGHGVPSPTENGEIWVFDQNYTAYVPASLYDIHTWISGPTVFIYDCNYAGLVVETMEQFRLKREADYQKILGSTGLDSANSIPTLSASCNLIQLGACSRKQCLPIGRDLPSDLFSSCITDPIKTALYWFVIRKNLLLPGITTSMIDSIPGSHKDRHSPLGQLNWIFVAITDTIAWTMLRNEPETFHTLYREDVMLANIMRNYLLAERIMQSFGRDTVIQPELPPAWNHSMWKVWDLVVDQFVCQLPSFLNGKTEFTPNMFFQDQIRALDIWLAAHVSDVSFDPPDQLVILLQMLLKEEYRRNALSLLDKILTFGRKAVIMVLQAGFLPFLIKMAQRSDADPRIILIWGKIIGVDKGTLSDLVKERCHIYFIKVLSDQKMPPRYVTTAFYILTNLMHENQEAKRICFQEQLIQVCLDRLSHTNSKMRQWNALCMGTLWSSFDPARKYAIRNGAIDKISVLLFDERPETRAAAVYALGKLVPVVNNNNHEDEDDNVNEYILEKLANMSDREGSPLVRKELVCALYAIILQCGNEYYTTVAAHEKEGQGTSNSEFIDPSKSFRKSSIGMKRLSIFRRSSQSSASQSAEKVDHRKYSLDSKFIRRPFDIKKCSCELTEKKRLNTIPDIYENCHIKSFNIMKQFSEDPNFEVQEMAVSIVSTIRKKSIGMIMPTNNLRVDITEEGPEEGIEDLCNFSSFTPGPPPSSTFSASLKWGFWFTRKRRLTSQLTSASESGTDSHAQFPVDEPALDEYVKDDDPDRHILGQSNFFEWCNIDPDMPFLKSMVVRPSEQDEKDWRYLRNTKVREESEKRLSSEVPLNFDQQIFLKKEVSADMLKFDPFLPQLISADSENIYVWDFEAKLMVRKISNNSLRGQKISLIHIANSHDVPLLLIGYDDGAMQVWKDYYTDDNLDVVTAWRAVPPGKCYNKTLEMVSDWEQASRTFLVAGNLETVMLWDTGNERLVNDIPTLSDHQVTCIKGNSCNTPLFATGFCDGSVHLYDRRLPSPENIVLKMYEHRTSTVDVFLRDDKTSLVTASTDGDVKFWDLKMPLSTQTINTQPILSAIDMHPRKDVITCGTLKNGFRTMTPTGEILSDFQYHTGVIGQKVGPVASIAFHPYWPHLAVGTTNNVITVYSSENVAPMDVNDLICSECEKA